MAEADELDLAKLKLDVVEDWIAEVVGLADAVTDKSVVGVEAEEIGLGVEIGVELGVAEDAVVEGGTGVDVLEVGGTATGDVLVAGGLAGVDVLDSGGW